MLSYAQTPAMERRNLEDRLGRIPSKRSAAKARSRTEPDRTRKVERETGAERILSAGSRGSGEVEVEPEAERAARFILEADDPDDDVEEAVDLIKEAGKPKDTREDEGGEGE